MVTFPVALVVTLALMVALSRPLLEARRPVSSLPLLAGMILGPSLTGLIPPEMLDATAPILALAGGWLALTAAESWDLGTLRRSGAGRRILLTGVPALTMVLLAILWPTAVILARGLPALASLLAPAVILACASIALDPTAVRESLAHTPRPGPVMRMAPLAASLALGTALAATPIASGLHATFVTLLPWVVLWHVAGTLLFGAALGVLFAGLIRLAQGRGAIAALLVALPLVAYGVARLVEMPPLALVFVAGVVLANDPLRRDLVFTILREHHLAFSIAVLLLAGARVPAASGEGFQAVFLLMAASVAVARPLAWRFVPSVGVTMDQALPMSPLAILIAQEIMFWPGSIWILPAMTPAIVAVAFVIDEAVWLMLSRNK